MKEQKYTVRVGDHTEFDVNREDLDKLDIRSVDENKVHLIVDGQSYTVEILSSDLHNKSMEVAVNGGRHNIKIKDSLDMRIDAMGMKAMLKKSSSDILAPMPGLVLKVLCKEGDTVAAGQPMLILEAMKMENVLKSEGPGTVKAVYVDAGDTVEKNQIMVAIAPEE